MIVCSSFQFGNYFNHITSKNEVGFKKIQLCELHSNRRTNKKVNTIIDGLDLDLSVGLDL